MRSGLLDLDLAECILGGMHAHVKTSPRLEAEGGDSRQCLSDAAGSESSLRDERRDLQRRQCDLLPNLGVLEPVGDALLILRGSRP